MKKYLLLAAPALAFAAPAYAQDAAVGGFRIEALVGYDQIGIPDEEFEADPAQITGKIEGALYGGSVGFDFGMGAVMLGVDAEFTETTGDRTIYNVEGPTDVVVKFGRDLYVGGRLTTAFTDNVKGYVKAGYTNLRVSGSTGDEDLDEAIEDLDLDVDENLHGVRGAVGVTFAPEGPTYYGAEFRYSNYESDVDRKQVALVVGYRF
jgi:outer membrane immunogenic protein